MGCQNISSRAKRAILYQFNQSLFLHDCRIILYISAFLEHFILRGEQVLFHTEALVPQKANLALIRKYCTNLLSSFFLHFLKIKKKTSVSSHYNNFTGEGSYSPTYGSHPVNA